MLIEAYGAQDAMILADRYSFDFLTCLISQTAELRKTEEDREDEVIEDKQQKFIDKNKHRSVKLPQKDGSFRKIKLSQFLVTNNQFLGKS